MSIRLRLLHLLEKILVLPTVSFHENFINSFICGEIRELGLGYQHDFYGNIIVGYGQGKDQIAWAAHMDHPGFEVTGVHGKRADAEWFGGVAPKYFARARIVVYDSLSGLIRARGKVEKLWQNSKGSVDKLGLQIDGKVEKGDFGSWDLDPLRRRGDLILTKAADDLVGCLVILAALGEMKNKGIQSRVIGLFTCAEEQGFIGTLGSIRNRLLSPETAVVSVETSSVLPGVVLGGGPVIRLGDRTSMFDNRMVLFMDHIAQEIRRENSRFAYQYRVMDGGTCEATPYQLNQHIDRFDHPIHEIYQRWENSLQVYGKKLQGVE